MPAGDTKLKSDIAEHAVTMQLLKRGYRVLKPIGDRLAYDLALDKEGKLIRLQVKSAWKQGGNYTVDTRRTKTNRRRMVRARYGDADFDYAILYIQDLDLYYVVPIEDFNSYKSGISLVENKKRQRLPRAARFREAWDLLAHS